MFSQYISTIQFLTFVCLTVTQTSYTRSAATRGVANHHAGGAGGARVAAAVGSLLLAHGDHGTLGHLSDGHHVANGELGLGAAVDELAGVEALHGDPLLLRELVAVRVVEDDL